MKEMRQYYHTLEDPLRLTWTGSEYRVNKPNQGDQELISPGELRKANDRIRELESALNDIANWTDDLQDEWGDPGERAKEALNGSSLTSPIKIMIRTDILDSYGGAGNPHRPMSMRSMKLLNLCTKHKIKWEDKDRQPYDRCWLTLTTVNQKIALIQFLGLDVIEKLSIANQKNE